MEPFFPPRHLFPVKQERSVLLSTSSTVETLGDSLTVTDIPISRKDIRAIHFG
jgi:hypothetical protein